MTPDFQIIANSADQTALFKDRLVSLVLTDQAGQKGTQSFEATTEPFIQAPRSRWKGS